MNWACNSIIILGLAPWGSGEGSKVQLSLHFKANFKDFFVRNCVCVLTNERYITIKRDFHSVAWVIMTCPRGGTLWGWGEQGVKNSF